jgi:hypothetical protein
MEPFIKLLCSIPASIGHTVIAYGKARIIPRPVFPPPPPAEILPPPPPSRPFLGTLAIGYCLYCTIRNRFFPPAVKLPPLPAPLKPLNVMELSAVKEILGITNILKVVPPPTPVVVVKTLIPPFLVEALDPLSLVKVVLLLGVYSMIKDRFLS